MKTTCAYCGVGCSFDAHMRGETVVKMVPSKDGKANHGHSCVKGRFAWGYATHAERILHPMVREHHTDPWREVSWDEALDFAAERLRRAQAEHGRDSIGVITSSRCTNETYLVRNWPGRCLATTTPIPAPGLPFADRLWAEDHLRHLGRHP